MLFLFFLLSCHIQHVKYIHLNLDGVLIILPLLVLLTTVSSLAISSGTNLWDISWGSMTDCWDFDWCSAKLFRDCSWIISSLFWGATVSFLFAKDESVSSKSNLKVSFDFSICRWFLQITVFLSVSILYDLLGMSDSMIIFLSDQVYLDVFELIVPHLKVLYFCISIIRLLE